MPAQTQERLPGHTLVGVEVKIFLIVSIIIIVSIITKLIIIIPITG
jgi:hypothetical protein